MEPTLIALQVRFFGRVQGVGFRAFVKTEAARRGIFGTVRNLPDGAVEAQMIGPSDRVRRTIDAIREARRHQIARIDEASVRTQNVNRTGFEVVD